MEDVSASSKPPIPTIHVEEEARYAQPCLNDHSSFYAEAGMPTPYYEIGAAIEVNMACRLFSHGLWCWLWYDWRLCVVCVFLVWLTNAIRQIV